MLAIDEDDCNQCRRGQQIEYRQHPFAARRVGAEESIPNCRPKNSVDEFDPEVSGRNLLGAVSTLSTGKEPTEEWNQIGYIKLMIAIGAEAMLWLPERHKSRHSVDDYIEETANRSSNHQSYYPCPFWKHKSSLTKMPVAACNGHRTIFLRASLLIVCGA